MKLRYKFRFYPTPEQTEHLEKTFGACRKIYNLGLNMRSADYRAGIKSGYNTTSRALTRYKKLPGNDWLNEISCVPLQQSLRHLDTAYQRFFKKSGSYPKHKLKRGKQAAEYTLKAFKWNSTTRTLSISKLGRCRLRLSKTSTSSPTTVTITKDCSGRYFVTFVLDETIRAFPKTGKSVGIDMGLMYLATLSTGDRIDNPKLSRSFEKQVIREQRRLARKIKGSSRWERQRLRLARIEAHVADSRKDFYNKVTTDLVRQYDFIAVETLGVKNMMKNRSVARSFGDAAVGSFIGMLEYKSKWYGKTLVKVDRFFPSSKLCSSCGFKNPSMPLDVREWICPTCGSVHDRDINAARNILAEGHSVIARGESVSRTKALVANVRRSRRSVNLSGGNRFQQFVSSPEIL